jgi:hypothetical protein
MKVRLYTAWPDQLLERTLLLAASFGGLAIYKRHYGLVSCPADSHAKSAQLGQD